MKRTISRIVLACILLFLFTRVCFGQTSDKLLTDVSPDSTADESAVPDSLTYQQVRNITITGYKRTRLFIVQREVAIQEGETYTKGRLAKLLLLTREQLMNTSLFVDVIVTPYDAGSKQVDVVIEVKERWYIFPVPFFRVVDRNWNVWIKEEKASLDRVNFGLKLNHANATGLNDKFNLWVMGGYTQQLSVNYFRPYFDKKLQWGYNVGLSYGRNREVNYASAYNKLLTIDSSFFNRKFFRAEAGLSYRKGSDLRMQLKFGYTTDSFDSSVIKLNPNFLGGGKTNARFLDVTYAVQYYKVDYIPYPLRGWYIDGFITNRIASGRELNMVQIGGKFLSSWEIANKTWFALQSAAMIRFSAGEPYYNSKLLGFGDVTMQGLEYYVIDGAVGGMVRGTLRKQVYQFTIKKLFKSKSHSEIPFRFFAKVYGNMGYAYTKNPGTSIMNNKLLRTGGIGLDIVTIYDWAIKLDFSFNQFDSAGKLYLHTQTDF